MDPKSITAALNGKLIALRARRDAHKARLVEYTNVVRKIDYEIVRCTLGAFRVGLRYQENEEVAHIELQVEGVVSEDLGRIWFSNDERGDRYGLTTPVFGEPFATASELAARIGAALGEDRCVQRLAPHFAMPAENEEEIRALVCRVGCMHCAITNNEMIALADEAVRLDLLYLAEEEPGERVYALTARAFQYLRALGETYPALSGKQTLS